MIVKELTHSQQQPQAPKTHKKESTVRLTTRITMIWATQRSLLYSLKDSIEVSARNTLCNQQANSKRLRLLENAQSDTFKALGWCFENAPSTALTIVCTINVSIDCKKDKVSNLNQENIILDCKSRQQAAWFVF